MCPKTADLEGGYGEVGAESERGEHPIMVCSTGLDLLQSSCEFLCAFRRTGVGSNSIMYNGGCTGCTISARGSSTFKKTQTTGTLDVKELPEP